MGSSKRLWFVYLSGFLMAVHFASVSYINSSFLKQFVGDNVVSALYIGGALIGVCLLLLMPSLLRRYGSVSVFLFFISLAILAALGMALSSIAYLTVFLFLIHIAVDSLLFLCLDIHLEQEITKEGTTGSKRGILFAVANIAWVLSPLSLIFLINQNSFGKVYFLSGLILVPLFLIVAFFFKDTDKASVRDSNVLAFFASFLRREDKARVITLQFILNFFYAWMVIYLPLLLNREMGFGWDKIGFIFMIMLLPFLLFELPAGILSDKKTGEKELIIAGLSVMFITALLIPAISAPVFWIWALVLFGTRVGASILEVSAESYFFKHVKEEDTGLISIFRMARPLSYIVAPLIALPVVYFSSYSSSFYFLSLFLLLGLFFIPKVDTK